MNTLVYDINTGTTVLVEEGKTDYPEGLVPGLDYRFDDAKAMTMEQKKRLLDSDYTQLPDAPFTEEQKIAWAVYRQALRELNNLPEWPDVLWPIHP